jgi:hypothetical protein
MSFSFPQVTVRDNKYYLDQYGHKQVELFTGGDDRNPHNFSASDHCNKTTFLELCKIFEPIIINQRIQIL